jgi:hypothetical protein
MSLCLVIQHQQTATILTGIRQAQCPQVNRSQPMTRPCPQRLQLPRSEVEDSHGWSLEKAPCCELARTRQQLGIWAARPSTSAVSYGDKMNDELIQALATATRIACTTLTSTGQAALQSSLDRACGPPAGCSWERRAAAHAEFFTALAAAAGDPCAARILSWGAEFAYGLMTSAGRAADGIVINSRKRMLAHLRAGDTTEATLEMERHLTILNFMSRLATIDPGRARLGRL